MPARQIALRNNKLLNDIGFGVQHLPRYRQTARDPHTHDILEMAYVVSGKCAHRIGKATYDNGPGSLGIVHYSQEHDFVTDAAGIDVYNLYFDIERRPLPPIGAELQHALQSIVPMHPVLRHQQNRFVHLVLEPDGELLPLLRAMDDEQTKRRPGWREALLHLQKMFLIACARHVHEHGLMRPKNGDPTFARMEDLRRRIDADSSAPIRLGKLAEEMDLSRHYLCRAFKKHTGVSIGAYQLRQRINNAMQMLLDSRDSVLDVALACGFSDQSFFNRKFKELAGVTPTQWRKR